MTVQAFSPELFVHWIEYVDATPKTIETYTKSIRRFARYVKENSITPLTRTNIIAYRDELKITLKPATVKAYIVAVRLFF
ncbi:MAG: phage integrase N-terminal SAM-like domain-containing protein [Ruminococcus sp.]|nr:phage integrase N-terminal SAM-like domain-containing protein [Ruminococcus sp.]